MYKESIILIVFCLIFSYKLHKRKVLKTLPKPTIHFLLIIVCNEQKAEVELDEILTRHVLNFIPYQFFVNTNCVSNLIV